MQTFADVSLRIVPICTTYLQYEYYTVKIRNLRKTEERKHGYQHVEEYD